MGTARSYSRQSTRDLREWVDGLPAAPGATNKTVYRAIVDQCSGTGLSPYEAVAHALKSFNVGGWQWAFAVVEANGGDYRHVATHPATFTA